MPHVVTAFVNAIVLHYTKNIYKICNCKQHRLKANFLTWCNCHVIVIQVDQYLKTLLQKCKGVPILQGAIEDVDKSKRPENRHVRLRPVVWRPLSRELPRISACVLKHRHNGPSRSSKVIDFDSNRKHVCDFLLFTNSTLGTLYLAPFQRHCRFFSWEERPHHYPPEFLECSSITDVPAPRSEDPKLIIR